MAEFFTRKGDDGTTGFLGEGRLDKDDLRMETLGTLDECSAHCGVVRAKTHNSTDQRMLVQIQRDLYQVMAETAADPQHAAKFRIIGETQVLWLEEQIQRLTADIQMPSGFILPGETELSAEVSVTRTVARRAERRLTSMMKQGLIENRQLIRYLNRLSSLLFALEISVPQKQGKTITSARENT
jgi:cob(I)alamin adenosyltransferase